MFTTAIRACLAAWALLFLAGGVDAQDPLSRRGNGLEVEDASTLAYAVIVLGFVEQLDEGRVVAVVEGKMREAGIRPVRLRINDVTDRPFVGIWVQSVYGPAIVGWAYNISFHRPVSYQVGSARPRQALAVTWGGWWPTALGFPEEPYVLSSIGKSFDQFLEDFVEANH